MESKIHYNLKCDHLMLQLLLQIFNIKRFAFYKRSIVVMNASDCDSMVMLNFNMKL